MRAQPGDKRPARLRLSMAKSKWKPEPQTKPAAAKQAWGFQPPKASPVHSTFGASSRNYSNMKSPTPRFGYTTTEDTLIQNELFGQYTVIEKPDTRNPYKISLGSKTRRFQKQAVREEAALFGK
jgi:hypothetical protein